MRQTSKSGDRLEVFFMGLFEPNSDPTPTLELIISFTTRMDDANGIYGYFQFINDKVS